MTREEVDAALERLADTVLLLRRLKEHADTRSSGAMTTMSMRGYGIPDAILGLQEVIHDCGASPHLRA